MKLPKFLKRIIPKSKQERRNAFLMEEYNKGRYLKVNDDTDNKQHLLDLEVKNE